MKNFEILIFAGTKDKESEDAGLCSGPNYGISRHRPLEGPAQDKEYQDLCKMPN